MSENTNDVIDIAEDGSHIYAPDPYNAEDDDKFSHINTLAEAIGHFYKGKVIQVYWGESGGNINYSEFSISNNLFVEGKVLWGRGEVFAIESEVETQAKTFKTVILFNCFNVYLVSPLDGVDVMNCFKGRIKKIKSKGVP
ncbi:hypothetical protein M0R72_02130 [Candidatus Pacearchaeota archaeon]|jgi:hypothetical protein|nr:hypothetical protein [Candidatus Pacearchaeota archaeon]